jgi:hypothetical protein
MAPDISLGRLLQDTTTPEMALDSNLGRLLLAATREMAPDTSLGRLLQDTTTQETTLTMMTPLVHGVFLYLAADPVSEVFSVR